MKSAVPFLLALIGLNLAGAEDTYQPRNTQKPGEDPPTAEEAATLITVPSGFQVRLFAGDPDVRQPVAMALDDRGRLFVAESYSYKEWQKKGEDRILIFEDTDNDGRHDSRKVFVSGIDHLSGMTVGWGGVWVCSSPNLLFYPDANRDDIPDSEPEVVLDGWTTEGGHNFFNGLTWGPDGWLYGRHGITRPSKVGRPGTSDEERIEFDCSIWRYHPARKTFDVVCRGTTNPWGLDWNDKGDMFFTNNVNGHLWHAIPGAYYPRMGERNDPFTKYVYDRIGMCCDHLHHAGAHTDWTKTRDGKGVHGELGGGHSHCGGMIYQGGKWPEKYKGKMFMCNTHGRRVNVDRLDEEGVTYVARHEPDFLHANNPWFRGVQLVYGPDGDVYLSDWVDNGECHDNDGVHRTSGRIYKIIYGDPSPPMKENLYKMTFEELIALHDHENEWYARKAEWILRERITKGNHPTISENKNHPRHKKLLSWIANDAGVPEMRDSSALQRIPQSSPRVLRQYASKLSRYSPESRWDTAKALLLACPPQTETTDLLIYYGIKDIAASHPDRCLDLLRAAEDSHYLFTKNLAQNLAENGVYSPVITMLDTSDNEGLSATLFEGFAAGVKGRKDLETPEGWDPVFQSCFDHPDMRIKALAINLVFDVQCSTARIKELLKSDQSEGGPWQGLSVLEDYPINSLAEYILPLVKNPSLSAKALAVLAKCDHPEISSSLIDSYESLPDASKPLAINALAGNKVFANSLLTAIKNKKIPRHAVTAYHARQIRSFRDKDLNKQLTDTWGKIGSTSGEKKSLIKQWQDQLLADVIAKGDLKNGHAKFQQLCMACHQLNGEGGVLGPDLNGANRSDTYYLLENIIDPSATLPSDFQLTVITKKDGMVLSGNVMSENEYSITLKNLTGEFLIQSNEIQKRETLKQSIMPEGLLNGLSDHDVRDLIAYLQTVGS